MSSPSTSLASRKEDLQEGVAIKADEPSAPSHAIDPATRLRPINPAETLRLSTVTPVYRGAPFLEDLVTQLEEVREELARGDYPLRLMESIFVVDDAVDESKHILDRLSAEREWIHVVVLSTNYGQHAATAAGILHSSGDWIATLDEDGQHPPRLLPEMVDEVIRGGQDLLYASPSGGPHASPFRNLSSRMAKSGIAWLAGNPQFRDFNSFRVGRGPLLRAAAALVGPGVYFDIALSWFTRRILTRQVELVDPRQAESGYSLSGLLAHAWRLIKSSDVRPQRLGFAVGLVGTVTGLVGIVWTLYLRLFSPSEIALQGWASLFVTILFFGGLTSLIAGFTLEYVVSLHQAKLGRPVFATVDRSKDRLILGHDKP